MKRESSNGGSVTFNDVNLGVGNPTTDVSMTHSDTSWVHDWKTKATPERPGSGVDETGCLILGEESRKGNRYVTRYRIDHVGERRHLCGDILREELCTCTLEENRETCCGFVMSFLGSEAFLVTLHMSVIVIGVMKEARNLRDIDKQLHLIHSILETIAAVLQAFLRIIVIWRSLKASEKSAMKLEHDVRVVARERSLRRVIVIYTVISAILIAGAIAAFLSFYFLDHLEWSLLTNSFVTVLAMLFGNILSTRISKSEQLIREDQHKVLIYESNLLLTQTQDAMKSHDLKVQDQIQDTVGLFLRAVRDTEEFSAPDHIQCRERRLNDTLNYMTTIDMQSAV